MNRLAAMLRYLGTCGISGLIVGSICGALLGLLNFLDGPLAPTTAELWRMWLMLAVFGWLLLLFVLCGLARLSSKTVAFPALVNSALVTGLTILICRLLDAWAWGWLIGVIVGILIGFVLCGLYRNVFERR